MAALALASCGPGKPLHPPNDTAKIVDTIKADEVRWNADWRAEDAAKIAAHYAPEAVLMVPGQAPAVGSAAIRAALDQAMAAGGLTVSFSSDQVSVARSGDLAVARGAYTQTTAHPGAGAPVSQSGTYVTVYKPGADGAWRAVWDINTPGAPPPGPAPAAAP
jgi:uncharacterized protein (TIGR02246 family)